MIHHILYYVSSMIESLLLSPFQGGALLREKMVEVNAKRFICIVDDSKMVDCLGRRGVPVEITQFQSEYTRRKLETTLGCAATIRASKSTDTPYYITDNGNFIVDCVFKDGIKAENVAKVAADMKSIVGVIEHGFFLGMAERVVIATNAGELKIIDRK